MSEQIKQNVQGILLLDKPIGLTSNAALQRIKRLFRAKKAGHTGSLDPLATGMLPICFGEATKFSQFLLDSDKRYRVVMKLGVKTNTGDAEGEIIETRPVTSDASQQFENVLCEFLGTIQQVPPMFSAIKHQGKPLYYLARKGIEVERKSRTVQIFDLQYRSADEANNALSFDVHCSKGTYVRTLVEDIGERLGCGAHVSGLHRLAVTPYQQHKMYDLESLENLSEREGLQALYALLLPAESSVQSLPAIQLTTSSAFYLRMGQPVIAPQLTSPGLVRVFADDGKFMGIGEILDDGRVAPRRLIASAA